MKPSISLISSLTFCLVGSSLQLSPAVAQVTADGTTNTTVNPDGDNFIIEQGDRVGDNLFHSFEEFSVPTLGSAAFNNANDIANIFSRVTGSNISDIDGLISANGAANLFLINPNGIIFGENARLNLGGSFFASGADSLLFDNGLEFSASNPTAPPLIEVNIPIGLGFRDNPGAIVNRSFVQNDAGDFVGLEVTPGKNLTLVGGNINFEAGEVTARGGNIELGGLSAAGIVGIGEDSSLNFPEDVEKADITLSNAADVDVRGTGGGSITINARNLSLEAGEFGSSFLRAGITADSTSADAQAGDIIVDVAENITLNDSRIRNRVDSGGVGNSGNITISTTSLDATNGGDVDASTFGLGDAGSVQITATDTITFDGEDSEGFVSGVSSSVNSDAVGDAGGVTITTGSLSLTNGGGVSTSTLGRGDAGSVKITAIDTIMIDGGDSASGVVSSVSPGAKGNAGGVTITTGSLSLTNGGIIDASTLGRGDAGLVQITANDAIMIDRGDSISGVSSLVGPEVEGDAGGIIIDAGTLSLNGGIVAVTPLGQGNAGGVTITTGSLSLTNGGIIDASTIGRGNAGQVTINAKDTISVDGEDSEGFVSGVYSSVNPDAEGDAGGVTIDTVSLSLTNGGQVSASTFGQGNAGQVTINAKDTISVDGEDSEGFVSGVYSSVNPDAEGDAGGVTITTGSLSLTNGGRVNTSTFGRGDAGSVQITAIDTIIIHGGDRASGVVSSVNSEAEGNAGDVTITTGSLSLTNGGGVDASTGGQGNGGAVQITARDNITIDGEDSGGFFVSGVTSQVTSEEAEGDAGGVTITTGSLSLTNGGIIDASTFGRGDAGSVKITASDNITIDGEDPSDDKTVGGIFSTVGNGAIGNAGGVEITTGNLTLTNAGTINASTFGQGNAGQVTINASDTISIDGDDLEGFNSGAFSQVNSGAEGDAGGVTIDTGSLSLTNGGTVSADTFGRGNAGSVQITASDNISIDGEDSEGFVSEVSSAVALEEAVGKAGGVTIDTGSLSLTNGGRVIADTFGQGNAGSVQITASDNITIDGEDSDGVPSEASSSVTEEAEGDAGGVTINTGSLSLTNGGRVIASTFGRGNAGEVEITASDITIDGETSKAVPSDAGSVVNSESEGDAGGVTISTGSLSLTNGGRVIADTFGQGNAGLVKITASDNIIIEGETVNGFPSEASSSVNLFAEGDAGGVIIDTVSLSLTDGGRVVARTFGEGNAGDVTVNARESIAISGTTETKSFRSSISADAFISSGDGGNVNISTNRLTIKDGGSIQAGNFDNVDSLDKFSPGTGQPGNINIEANSLSLSNQGRIEATTQSEVGEAANINLTIAEDIFFKNNSFISARALGNANGGNVTINADDGSIVAFPNQNNDIIANAQQGNGGNINITTQAIFGLEERPSTPPNQTNDIDASSEFGLQGDFSLNTPENEPSRGLVDLPENVVNPEDLISQNACKQGGQSKFTLTGRGGLPTTPDRVHSSDEVEVGLVKPAIGVAAVSKDVPVAEDSTKIVPAKGWIRNEQGEVFLVGYDPTVSNITPQPESLDLCQPQGDN